MKILSVVGARPNFMKIAPFIRAIGRHNVSAEVPVEHVLVHTGQHYDDRMSMAFFNDLGIPPADINLEVGSGTHAEQVGNTMIAFEKVLLEYRPDWVVVVGDVNATLACSVTAAKEGVRCCHIEAGLRSGDLGMPEEINRLVTDRLSTLLLTPDESSSENLRREGTEEKRIRFVGNIMIDTLDANMERAAALDISDIISRNIFDSSSGQAAVGEGDDYALMTLHRPSNVDDPAALRSIAAFVRDEVSRHIPLLWSLHPRTVKMLRDAGLLGGLARHRRLILLSPLAYHDMLKLNMHARIMLTDSGGLQEECCVLGTPFLTLRPNTERPVTLTEYGGTGVLTGNDIAVVREAYRKVLDFKRKPFRPPLWDGNTAARCLEAILS